jgi:hypothetical protein
MKRLRAALVLALCLPGLAAAAADPPAAPPAPRSPTPAPTHPHPPRETCPEAVSAPSPSTSRRARPKASPSSCRGTAAGSWASLAWRAPPGTFEGAISLGFCSDLDFGGAMLCGGSGQQDQVCSPKEVDDFAALSGSSLRRDPRTSTTCRSMKSARRAPQARAGGRRCRPGDPPVPGRLEQIAGVARWVLLRRGYAAVHRQPPAGGLEAGRGDRLDRRRVRRADRQGASFQRRVHYHCG